MTPRNVSPAVSESPLFAGIEETAREAILKAAERREFERGEFLFHQGEPVRALFVLESGSLKLAQVTAEGDEVIVHAVAPGDPIAGIALLEKQTYPVSAEALAPSTVLLWPRERLHDLVARHPLLRHNVLTVIAGRMRESLSRVSRLSTAPAAQRLAAALLRLAQQNGRPVDGGTLIDQPLSRLDLAELAGTSMYTASRFLSQWAREGVLEVGRQRVVVCSLQRLEKLVES